MTPSRGKLGASLLLVTIVAALALALVWETGPLLRARHQLQSRMARYNTIVTLEIDSVGSLPMFLNPRDGVITRQMMWRGKWEPRETYWFIRALREGDTVVDLGANVGYFTLIAARLVGDTGHVYAFEPDPEGFALLERNVRLNGLRNVTLLQKAASNENGSIELYLSERNLGDHRIYAPADETRTTVEVEAVRLDDYFEDLRSEIDFVKIDTQGAELAILEGMEAILEASPRLLMNVEYWPRGLQEAGASHEALLDLLRRHDFRFFDVSIDPIMREVEREELNVVYAPERGAFTNLFLVRGRETSEKLRQRLAAWQDIRAREPERREVAEEAIRAVERLLQLMGPGSADFPHVVVKVND